MKKLMSMREALNNPHLFAMILEGESWATWRLLLIAIMGEELTEKERAVFASLTGRPCEPGHEIDEAWFIIGRRGGKTRAIAVLAAYLASLCDWLHVLAPGEFAQVAILSATIDQAQKCLEYLKGIFSEVPALSKLVVGETADSITLSNRIRVECKPASFRTVRGSTAVAIVCDEIAFWRSENSSNPDTEILAAVRPSLATTHGPLICISSPYARRGEVWEAYRNYYGPEGSDPKILVAKGSSKALNPTLNDDWIARQVKRDPLRASSELFAEFRTDVEQFLNREAIDAATVPGRYELPREAGVGYIAFVDPSGGSSDDMVMAIAHREQDDVLVLDCVRSITPPFSPDDVVREFAKTLAAYGVYQVYGDRYGGEWPAERFRAHGVTYEPAKMAKSEIYKEFLPLINADRVELLDNAKLFNQLNLLERRTSRGGRDSIDHPTGQHDDVANAVCGALVFAAGKEDFLTVWMRAYG